MIVVDASFALKWVKPEDQSDAALVLLGGSELMIAPAFWLVETANALWKSVRRAELTPAQAVRRQATLREAPLSARDDAPLIVPALELATTLDHPIYDCLYLALALQEHATLVTADRKFAASVRRAGYGAHLRVIGDAPAQP